MAGSQPAAPTSSTSLGLIGFVMDSRLSRERTQILNRVVTALKRIAQVEIFSGDLSEQEILDKIQGKPFQLVLAPWYRYLIWSKIEAHFGLSRNVGPAFAGYFAETLLPYELGEIRDSIRVVLLDFAHMSPRDSTLVIQSLISDQRRSGIRPLLAQTKDLPPTVFHDAWKSGQSIGPRLDAVLALPLIADPQGEWRKRVNPIRICFGALWSLIYDEGPGKTELSGVSALRAPRAEFFIGVDHTALIMRLYYPLPGATPKSQLQSFWPNSANPNGAFSAAQLLLRHADFVRVHAMSEGSEVEVTVGLFQSAASSTAPQSCHTLWVEPLASKVLIESDPTLLKALPTPNAREVVEVPKDSTSAILAQNKFVQEAGRKIRELKELLEDRDELIQELRSGGVGSTAPLAPPDPEMLLEAFQTRYFEARYQIRECEIEIQMMERRGATHDEVEALQKKMADLTQREASWIKKISSVLEVFRDEKRQKGVR